MGYRVVEFCSQPGSDRETIEDLRAFDSAYAAVDFITTAWYRGDRRATRLHLLDGNGRVLLRPDDIISSRITDW